MSTNTGLHDLEDLLLRFGAKELEAERALKQLQLEIRQLSTAGDDAAAAAAEVLYDRLQDALGAIRERIYRLETQVYSKRRRQRR